MVRDAAQKELVTRMKARPSSTDGNKISAPIPAAEEIHGAHHAERPGEATQAPIASAASPAMDVRLKDLGLDAPSRGLIIGGLAAAALSLVCEIINIGFLVHDGPSAESLLVPIVLFWSLGVLNYGFVVLAGIRIRSLKTYKTTMAGSILAIVPVSPFFVLTCPFGIWALRRLGKPEVKRNFLPDDPRLIDLGLNVASRGLVVGGLGSLAISTPCLIFFLASLATGHAGDGVTGLVVALYLTLCVLRNALVAFAGIRMRSLRGFGIARWGGLFAVLPVSPLFIFTCPSGIWALKRLSQTDVKSAFRAE